MEGGTEEEEDCSQSSGLDTDSEIFSDSDPIEPHLQERGEFFGCYLLISRNPKFKGRTYIGFTVDPNRRIKQHNKGYHKGGARKTSGKGPWDMVLIVHGFPNHIAALRFEWAWQHPNRSRRLGKSLPRKKRKESPFEYRFRILAEMLSVGPWWRLPLTIRWLKQEHQIQFPPVKQPPVHMPIAYGLVDFCKTQEDHFHTLSRPDFQEEEKRDEPSSHSKDDCSDGVDIWGSCQLCNAKDKNVLLHCYHRHCALSAHVTCLARWLTTNERDQSSSHLIPVTGPCPKCGQELLWGELIRVYKHKTAKKKDCDGRVKSTRKRKEAPNSQPTIPRKRVNDMSKSGQSHWSEALHM